jgi:putative hydrolase of the HAD superfamily
MKINLLIFDLFGTLIFQNPKLKKEDFFVFYKSLGMKLEKREDFENLSKIFAKAMKSSSNWQELSQRVIKEALGEEKGERIEKLAKFLKENLIYQPFDDVKEVINLPYEKAILTDASRFLFSGLGFEKYFQIFTPKETKFLKPDPKAFLAVLNFFKVKPEETLMIGDELERDLIPAKNLGMEAILIDRENKIKNTPIKKISSLKELKEILI